MRVDKRATAAARKAHKAGVQRLRKAFGATEAKLQAAGLQHGHTKLYRRRPHVPPMRDAEHQAKHKARKRARAARKRNRKEKR
jgi:hypothetical protein